MSDFPRQGGGLIFKGRNTLDVHTFGCLRSGDIGDHTILTVDLTRTQTAEVAKSQKNSLNEKPTSIIYFLAPTTFCSIEECSTI